MDIQKIINTALELDNNLLKEFFELHQKESGLKPELFFGMLMAELKIERKKLIWQGFDLDGFLRLASQFNILEDFLKKQLHLLRKRNKDLSDSILTKDEGLITKDIPSYVEGDELDCNDSSDSKFVEKISENHFKEGPKIKNTKTDTKNSDVQGQGTQTPIIEYPFNRMPIDQVRLFFTPLIETENNEGNRWMSPESFEIFLRRSFEKESSLLKPDINLGKGTKLAIIKLFYEFYHHCVGKNYSSKRNKKPYVKLLRDAFNTGIFSNLDNDSFNDKANWDWPNFKSKVQS